MPGAYGFVINTSQGNVVYTGDFRTHGAKPEMTREFVDKAKQAEPAAVVTEATNMTGTSISFEKEVEDKLNCIVGQAEGIVLTEFAYADIDRLNSFFRITKKNGRCLAVSLRQAYLLNALGADKGLTVPNLNDQNVLIFRKSKERHDKRENQVLEQYADKTIDVFETSKQQCKVVLAFSTISKNSSKSSRRRATATYYLRRNHSTRRWRLTSISSPTGLITKVCPSTTYMFQGT